MPIKRFGPFLPELSPIGSGGSRLVRNVLPQKNSYIPARNLAPLTEALDGPCRGATFAKAFDGTVQGIAGDATKLYRLSGGTNIWSNVSRASGYVLAEEDRWRYTGFGDLLIATNYSNEVQKFDLSNDALFSDLGASVPKARFAIPVSNFLVLADIDDTTDGVRPSRVHWSADRDPTNFPTVELERRQLRSNLQDLIGEDGAINGLVTGLSSGAFSIFRERAIVTATELFDADFVFAFDVIEGGRGCLAPDSIIRLGGQCFYLGEDGFYAFNGSSSQPIGASVFDKFFFDNVDEAGIGLVQGDADARLKLLYWAFPTINNPGVLDHILVYNWETGEAAIIEGLTIQAFTKALSTAFTVEDLATIAASLDDIPGSLDDPIYAGGGLPQFAAFGADSRMGTFAGATLQARLGVEEEQYSEDGRSFVRHVRPVIDGAPCVVECFGRDRAQDDPRLLARIETNEEGRALVRAKARYHSYEIEIPAGTEWRHAQGIEVTPIGAGDRMPGTAVPADVPAGFMLTDRGEICATETGELIEIEP